MNKNNERLFLSAVTAISLILLPFAIFKRSFKDWIIVYFFSLITNSLADRWLVSAGYLHYPVRPFSKKVSIHLPFDYVLYPLLLLYYNQWTLNSRPSGLFLKLIPFIIPQVLIETVAEKQTDLITWKKGWTWYHSMFSLMIKFLCCRLTIGMIRILNSKATSVT